MHVLRAVVKLLKAIHAKAGCNGQFVRVRDTSVIEEPCLLNDEEGSLSTA